jgi:hypothetical protein
MLALKIPRNQFFTFFLFLIITGLLLFGMGFSKFQVLGSLYLHDLLLLLLTLGSLLHFKRYFRFPYLLPIVFLSFFYLGYSLFACPQNVGFILRQFAFFLYFTCSYLIFNKVAEHTPIESFIKFIIWIAKVSVVLQLGFHAYHFSQGNFNLLDDYNYFSPLTVMGIVVFAAYILVYYKDGFNKYLLFGFTLALSLTLGHSSAFLAVFVLFFVLLLIRVNRTAKIIILSSTVLAMVALVIFIPQFTDVNSIWRLKYWAYALNIVFMENFGVLGQGFHHPYASQAFGYELYNQLNSALFIDKVQPDMRYLSPFHNSFISLFFHIGFLPGLLLFVPYLKIVKYVRHRDRYYDKDAEFLILALTGISVWVSLNVILELPHAALFVWLVYFTLSEKWKKMSL